MFDYEETFYYEKEVRVPAKKAWDILSMPGHLTLFHPFMEEHTAESWDGIGNDLTGLL
ncbi:hypothetical protein J2755_001275 [Methanohalophilus levihalophilus]|uniref:hypothetical protein n=1 Tax=Methanohalophilus levihalophilus TaxID=1431282 RepID=UPI001AE3B50B|nr:hypothetical protein [Methanohalophilus levihalophilus]MBP2030341.1 hypothetical protein [Methanohalophilus levihalophilus]